MPSFRAPVGAVDELDIVALGAHFLDQAGGDLLRTVGGIVQDLDFMPILRVFHRANRADKPFDHIGLVVNRKLGRDQGEPILPAVGVEEPELPPVVNHFLPLILEE
jgi:hypothetical protein